MCEYCMNTGRIDLSALTGQSMGEDSVMDCLCVDTPRWMRKQARVASRKNTTTVKVGYAGTFMEDIELVAA